MRSKAEKVQSDATLIELLGGPGKLATMLGFKVQRVHNWQSRGIPPLVVMEHPHIFNLRPELGLPSSGEASA